MKKISQFQIGTYEIRLIHRALKIASYHESFSESEQDEIDSFRFVFYVNDDEVSKAVVTTYSKPLTCPDHEKV